MSEAPEAVADGQRRVAAHALAVPKQADGSDDWRAFAVELVTAIRASGERGKWMDANIASLGAMRKAAPDHHKNLLAAVHDSGEAD